MRWASVRSALDARGMMGAPGGRRGFRGRRLGGFRGYIGIGRWHVRRDRRERRGRWGMYDRRRRLRAVRQEVGIERDQAERPRHHDLVAQGARRVHVQPYADTRMTYFPASRRRCGAAFTHTNAAARAGPNLQKENPPGISPGGPTSIAPSLPPVHPRSEARSRTTSI